MDKQSLTKRQQGLTAQFNAVKGQNDQYREVLSKANWESLQQVYAKLQEGENELVKLQGRYAEVDELLASFPESKPQANVIKAEPATGEIVSSGEKNNESKRHKG